MFRLITLIGLAATLVAIVGHLVIFGPKRVEKKGARSVKRFGVLEILVHALTVASFLVLVGTGLWAVYNSDPLRGQLWLLHVAVGPLFLIGLAVLILAWARDCEFEPCDWEWAKKFGGYLWGDKHAPANRFNAGQKAYFWAVGALGFVTLLTGLGRAVPVLGETGQLALLWVHRFGALAFVMAGLAHLYLGTLANPGTLTAMITGKVTPQWARNHHPLWVSEGVPAPAAATETADLTQNEKSFEQE